MATETITIKVDSEAAKAYNDAAPRDQQKMRALLSLWLRDVARAESETLEQLMTEISRRAQARGLTPELLEDILREA